MATKKHILIIDDDDDIRSILSEQLASYDEFSVVGASTAQAGLDLARAGGIDLILLDVDLPDLDGREACKQLRKAGNRTPVIMLTAKEHEADEVLGFDSGANDYVTKPFKLALLIARIRAQLRAHESTDDAVLRLRSYEFRPGAKTLTDEKGRKVRLTEKETNILRYLYRAVPNAVGRDELLREVWGYNALVSTHTLETHIYRLRQKIEADPQNPQVMVTEGGGYKLRTE